ncbi:hypothetical protein ACOMHN_017163 [Nucella lapillus]
MFSATMIRPTHRSSTCSRPGPRRFGPLTVLQHVLGHGDLAHSPFFNMFSARATAIRPTHRSSTCSRPWRFGPLTVLQHVLGQGHGDSAHSPFFNMFSAMAIIDPAHSQFFNMFSATIAAHSPFFNMFSAMEIRPAHRSSTCSRPWRFGPLTVLQHVLSHGHGDPAHSPFFNMFSASAMEIRPTHRFFNMFSTTAMEIRPTHRSSTCSRPRPWRSGKHSPFFNMFSAMAMEIRPTHRSSTCSRPRPWRSGPLTVLQHVLGHGHYRFGKHSLFFNMFSATAMEIRPTHRSSTCSRPRP